MLAALLAAVVLVGACTPGKTPRVGMLAPDFGLNTTSGGRFRLAQERGKTVIINFWASWCGPCRNEMPELEAVFRQFDPQELSVVAVNVGESRNRALRYAEELGLTLPVAVDSESAISKLYFVRALPTSFFVDRDGVIQAKELGEMSRQTILDDVKKAMAGGGD